MEAPVVAMSRRSRIVRDFTQDEDEDAPKERQAPSGYHSPIPLSPEEIYPGRETYFRSPSRQDTDSVITQIRAPQNRQPGELRDEFNLPEKVADSFASPSPSARQEDLQHFDFSLGAIEEKSSYAPSVTNMSQTTGISGSSNSRMPEFFGHEVFQTVLHNPTTQHQLLLFSQSRLCGENMEYLEKVEKYHTLLNEVTKTMFEIHRDYISVNAPSQINIPESLLIKINKDLKYTLATTLPKMENVFSDSANEIERLVATDVYPRFVRHQMTRSASKALASDRTRYGGLGDCFVLTDPGRADNPIVYASDGFVKVTGYARSDIIPRNCRFLQGRHTDRSSVSRIKKSIDSRSESVELLLNYKKNGEPFWNLLYTTPLYDSSGQLAFFFGGQINCSTTIHNASDILRILAYSEDVVEGGFDTNRALPEKKGGFFKSFRTKPSLPTRAPGQESGLLTRLERLNLKTQMDEFYTAYSRYIVINAATHLISFHSAGITTLLYPSRPAVSTTTAAYPSQITPTPTTPATAPLVSTTTAVGQEIFRFLSQHTLNNLPRDFKSRVKTASKAGVPVSLDLQLCTKRYMGFERFVTHWTPIKDEKGQVVFVVCTLGSVGDAR